MEDEIEKAIKKVLPYESVHFNYFTSESAKRRFENGINQIQPILLKNKDKALEITYTLYKTNLKGKNIIAFLLKEGANPNLVVNNEPVISSFLVDEEFVKLFIKSGFDVNAKIFPNDNTLLMAIIKKYNDNLSFISSKFIISIIDYIFELTQFDPNVKNKDDETVYFYCLSHNYLFEASHLFFEFEELDYTNRFGNNALLLLSKSLIKTSQVYEIHDDNPENNNSDDENRRLNLEQERRRRNWLGGGILFGQNNLETFYDSLINQTFTENPNYMNSYNNKGEYVLYYLTSNDKLYTFLNMFLDLNYEFEFRINMNLKTEQIPYTALYNSVKNNLLDSANLLLNYKADANILDDETENTPLHLAILNKNRDIVRLLIPKTDLNIKNKDDLTPIELANKIKNKDILDIIKEETALWKGSSKSDLEKYDIFFEKPFDWSVCPVCLEYVERSDGCMFVSHDCAKTGHYYHRELYNRYNFQYDTTKIEWCTVCGRITEHHNHFKLTDVHAEKPPYENKDESVLERIQRGDNEVFFDNKNCIGLGGGGTQEKASRLRRLREYALELQDDIGKKKYVDAMKELIEEVWNAPLRREKKKIQKILEEKKFNNNLKNLPNVIKENNNNNSGENVNVEFDGELPTMLDPKKYKCYIRASENEGKKSNPVYEFHHKNRNGIDHSNKLICKEDLEMFIEYQNKEFGLPRFTKCFDLTCNAFLFPQEIKDIVSKELYEDYRKKFNKKIRKAMNAGGKTRKLRKNQLGGDIQHVLHKLENSVCYQPPLFSSKKNNTSKRFTLKKRI